MTKRWRVLAAVTVLHTTSGCILQPQPEVAKSPPRPSDAAHVMTERRLDQRPTIESIVSGESIDVTLSQQVMCNQTTPMVQDVVYKRHANQTEQLLNLAFGGTLIGLGGYLIAGPCTTTPDATMANPNPQSQACTSSQKSGAVAGGAASIGVGALFGAAFIYNVLKARDYTETIPAETSVSGWRACGARPMANTTISLAFADGQQMSQATNAQGHAHFDLASVHWTDEAMKSARAQIALAEGNQTESIDLKALPQYAEWQRRRTLRERSDRDSAKHEEELNALQDVEKALPTFPGGWTNERMDDFERTAQNLRRITAAQFTPSERSRWQAAQHRIDALLPSYRQALERERANAAKEAIQVGRRYIVGRVLTPSTVRFVSDNVMLSCPGGFITMHEFDHQNGFGAMIRSTWAVEEDVRANRIDGQDCNGPGLNTICAAVTLGCKARGLQ